MNILFLSPWYPHRYDSMAGLFVQKHAEAVALYADVKVLYVHADNNIKDFEIVVDRYNDIEEYRVYYPNNNKSFLRKITKTINYFNAYKKGFDAIRKAGWQPDIIHTNVLTRTPLIGYLYKLKHKTPYIITEHWTRLLVSRNQFHGFFRKTAAKIIVKNASYVLPVSEELLDGLKFNRLLLTKFLVVENVVDKCFYESYTIDSRSKKRLLNVTCFLEEAKNLIGLLRAIKKLSLIRTDFEMIFIGTGVDFDRTYNYYESLKIPNGIVQFVGEKTSTEVAEYMHNSDIVVQFSNYESAGVVVEESLACGTPIISTKVGIAPNFINDTNGRLVNVGDEESLTQALNYVLDHPKAFDRHLIQNTARPLFSYENIGQKVFAVYQHCLKG